MNKCYRTARRARSRTLCSDAMASALQPRHLRRHGLTGVLCAAALLAVPVRAEMPYAVVHSFGLAERMGDSPTASLILGSDGVLYGTAYGGGAGSCWLGCGVVFRVNRDGSGYRVLHHFGSSAGDGTYPWAGVVEGSDGMLYGTTESGGTADMGTLYRISPDGTGYAILHSFGDADGDGAYPESAPMEGDDGALYGTTCGGGGPDVGTVFTIDKDGTGYAVLYSFAGGESDGSCPYAALVQIEGGALFGTTSQGGAAGAGTLFRLNPDGTGYAVLHSFAGAPGDGRGPNTPLIAGSDGRLYGTTEQGGAGEGGTVFGVSPDGTGYSILCQFSSTSSDGYSPVGLVEGRSGALYGTTQSGEGTGEGSIFTVNKDGSGYTLLRRFDRTGSESQNPVGALVQDADGVLYGTTEDGGRDDDGTVFSIHEDGAGYALLWSFTTTGQDGYWPYAGLGEASDGNLYGTTFQGGAFDAGAVFRMSKDGASYEVIHSFTTDGVDGMNPMSAPVEASDGALYGVTTHGGVVDATHPMGQGVIFRLDKDGGNFSVIRRFTGPDGSDPEAGLIKGSDGNFYGATQAGGSANRGVVYKLGGDGTGYEVIHHFGSQGVDGTAPRELLEGDDGALYGTTRVGGNANQGVVYRLNRDGSSHVLLRHFGTSADDAQRPYAGLIQAGDGALYGVGDGGSYSGGALFTLRPDGSDYAVLRSFTDQNKDGYKLDARLVEGDDGMLYGPTTRGGTANKGTVFQINKDGTGYAIVHHFGVDTADGQYAWMPLLKASDGRLYGVTEVGGQFRLGTIFALGAGSSVPTPPEFTGLTLAGGGSFALHATGEPGTTYRLQRAADLRAPDWTDVASATAASDGKLTYPGLLAVGGPRFYRMVAP